MCGLVGLAMKPGFEFNTRAFGALMKEAQIRGQHATGISYVVDHVLHTLKEPVPQDKFKYPAELSQATVAIGHLRYSTSDLEFNQPNATEFQALAHNGVVTQAPPEQWEQMFRVNCKTRNDSEILLQMFQKETPEHPLFLHESSQACVMIDVDPAGDSLMFWRNEQRPLYFYEDDAFLAVASTRDILVRAGYAENIQECMPCVHYTYNSTYNKLISTLIRPSRLDLQHVR